LRKLLIHIEKPKQDSGRAISICWRTPYNFQ
jgi:hypothetical protein